MVQISMAHKIILFFLLLLSARITCAVELNEVKESIHQKGAEATLAELSWPYEKWEAFIKRVESGEEQWVSIAIELRTVSDAGGSFELDHSLAHAYSVNPSAFSGPLNPNQLCNPNYMELSTKPEAEKYLKRMEKILNGLPASEFKEACSNFVVRYSKWVSGWDGSPP